MSDDNFIEVEIGELGMDQHSNAPFLVLKTKDGSKSLPIWIGLFEASAIASHLEKLELTRPMTHDLIAAMLGKTKHTLTRVEIFDLKENTFYARLCLKDGENTFEIDSRPSDAIAIAIRMEAPIMIHRDLFEKASNAKLHAAPTQNRGIVTKEQWKDILEDLAPEDFGKYKM